MTKKKLQLWQNFKEKIVTKLSDSCDSSDQTQKLKLWQKSKTQIVTNSKNQIVKKLFKKSNCDSSATDSSNSSSSDSSNSNSDVFLERPWMSDLISDEGICWTSPATPGQLIIFQ